MSNILHFEALMTETDTILSNSYIFPSLKRDTEVVFLKLHNRQTVYSTLLDEVLNVEHYLIIEDSVSKMFIFKLSPNMYTMSDYHNIGLKNYANAYLIVEVLTIDFSRSN